MDSKHTKHLTIAIVFTIGGYLLTYIFFLYLMPFVTGGSPVFLKGGWIYTIAANFGFAAWLFMESKNIVWALAGLMFGIQGVILYYVIRKIV